MPRQTRLRKQRRRKWIGRALIGAAAVAAITFGLRTRYAVDYEHGLQEQSPSVDYASRLYDRHEMYVRRLAGTEYKPNPLPSVGDVSHFIRHVESAEHTFQQNAENFVSYVGSVQGELIDLTSSDFERFGYIRLQNGKFELIDKSEHKKEAVEYIREVLQGDFSHISALQDILNYRLPELALSGKEKLATVAALATVTKKGEYDKMTAEQRKTFALELYTEEGVVRQPVPDFEGLYKNSTTLLTQLVKPVSGVLIGSTPGMPTPEMVDDPSIVSKWHTHPLNDPNYFPSAPDEANSYLMGPNLLFSRTDNTLHVYSIVEGQSKEIYTTKLH